MIGLSISCNIFCIEPRWRSGISHRREWGINVQKLVVIRIYINCPVFKGPQKPSDVFS